MFPTSSLLALSFAAVVYGQQVGTLTAETHPSLTMSTCAADGSCTTSTNSIVLDANWRWLHSTSGSTNCYTGNTWDTSLCPDDATCTSNCALDGANYAGTYGIATSGNELKIGFVTGSNVGSRVYLMNSDDSAYEMFKLKNQEFTFTVDMSQLPCGLNGALYFVQMDEDGGVSRFSTNKAGAKYGTGYCDAQCPQDLKFISGQANVDGWVPSSNNANTGAGNYGSCCTEMDIWEGNYMGEAYTPHLCSVTEQTACTGASDCGNTTSTRYDALCDKDGCDFNSFRMGDKSFLGPGLTIDTSKPITVVTQFVTADSTDNGDLVEIRRFYVQDGEVIPNSNSTIAGVSGNSITDDFCTAQKSVFGDENTFGSMGGLKTIGDALAKGMVLVMSLCDDYSVNMLWLDSNYPTVSDPSIPGVARGNCSTSSGVPATVEAQSGSAYVIYSDIKVGPIDSTFANYDSSPAPASSSSVKVTTSTAVIASTAAPVTAIATSSSLAAASTSVVLSTETVSTSTSAAAATSTAIETSSASTSVAATSSPSTAVAQYNQCGGAYWTGASACVSPYTCVKQNDYYSQCL